MSESETITKGDRVLVPSTGETGTVTGTQRDPITGATFASIMTDGRVWFTASTKIIEKVRN